MARGPKRAPGLVGGVGSVERRWDWRWDGMGWERGCVEGVFDGDIVWRDYWVVAIVAIVRRMKERNSRKGQGGEQRMQSSTAATVQFLIPGLYVTAVSNGQPMMPISNG